MKARRIYDISVELGSQDITFPGDKPYSKTMSLTIEKSGICNVSNLQMSAHTGTHIDMPLHFVKNGKSLDDYTMERFIKPAIVIEFKDKKLISARDLASLDLLQESALLLKTDNSISKKAICSEFSEEYVTIDVSAAQLLVDKGINLVGIDYISIEEPGNLNNEIHKTLLTNGVFVLEGLNLADVPVGEYTLYCFPLKIKGGEASPVRAVLI